MADQLLEGDLFPRGVHRLPLAAGSGGTLSNTRLAKSSSTCRSLLSYPWRDSTKRSRTQDVNWHWWKDTHWSPKLTCQLLLFIWLNAMQTSSQHHSSGLHLLPGWRCFGPLGASCPQKLSPASMGRSLFQPLPRAAAHLHWLAVSVSF